MKAKGKHAAVTIYEIAKHVGVSPAAVSSVLANRHVERRIAAKTVERVRTAARDLGYVPNMAGRRLRASRSAMRQFDLAILTSYEAPLPLVGQALHALQKEVDSRASNDTHYAVSIEMFHAGRLHEKPELLDANRYHGVVVTNTLPEDDGFLAQVTLPYAVVVLGRRIPACCCVLEAPEVVGRRAAEILLDGGSVCPIVLHGRMITQAIADRVAAFDEIVTRRLGRRSTRLVAAGLNPVDGITTLNDYLAGGGACDAIFTVTDSLAVGAYHVLRRAGMQIPGEVAVVGVGDYEMAEFFEPPLTTVAGSNEAMVAKAIPLLFDQLAGETATLGEVVVMPPVCVRDSTRKRP